MDPTGILLQLQNLISIQPFVDSLSQQLNLPPVQIRLVLCLLACLPISIIYRKLKWTTAKHVFLIVFGLTFLYFVIGHDIVHILTMSAVGYSLLLLIPKNPFISCSLIMIFLVAAHIYMMTVSAIRGVTFDFTAVLMILTCKLCMLFYNYYDGQCLNSGRVLSS
eukprot:896192_1